ncbi:MAG: hypothetical protein M0P69_15880 [Bacteroidales bacterium]|jgi:hypothetical protein|nr:hypothetical protein [Bacteroidales bacterium]
MKNEIIIVKKDRTVVKSRYGTKIYYNVDAKDVPPILELKPGGKIKIMED